MIIQSITIENFRSFYGEQTISFNTNSDRNTSFIYAQNGVGKTNFLNAILWCLHGVFSDSFKRPKDVLNWDAKAAGRKSYHVSITFEENGEIYRVTRSGGDIHNFKVFQIRDGNSTPITQNPSLFINNILPKDMAGYFISDGEGGDLAVDRQGLISIEKSIHEILGFTVAQKSLDDLNTIKREIRDELKRVDVGNKLGEIEERLQVFDDSIETKQKQLDDNSRALRDYQRKYEEVEEKLFNSQVSQVQHLKKLHEQAKKDVQRFSQKLAKLEGEKVSLIRDFSWVAFADKLNETALDFIDDAEFEGRIPAPYNVSLVQDIMNSEECICGAHISEGTPAYEHIKSLLATANDSGITNRLHIARSRLTAIQTMKPNAFKSIERNLSDFEEASMELNKAEEQLELVSRQLSEIDDEKIIALEKDRRILKSKKDEAERAVVRLEERIEGDKKRRDDLSKQAVRLEGLSPRARVLKEKITFLEEVEQEIKNELRAAEASIDDQLIGRMNQFVDRYMRQNYKVEMRDGYKIGLVDDTGSLIPPSGGQSAIVSFMYISSLISIARERRDLDSSVLTAGAIAPLIFDAPFSKLTPQYAENIAKELPKLVDQLIILMYQDGSQNNIAEIVKGQGKLGKEFYLLEERAHPQGDKQIETVVINGSKIETTIYDAPRNKVIIKEEANYA